MNKFIAGILSFFLWLMPWWYGLSGLRERLTFDRDAVMTKIINCVESQDVAGLESMMRTWFKTNEPDLTAKIQQFYDAINGDIINMRKGAEGSRSDGGIYSEDLRFIIDTDEPEHYYLQMWYAVSNGTNRNDLGISTIVLATGLVGAPDRVIHFDLRAPEFQ